MRPARNSNTPSKSYLVVVFWLELKPGGKSHGAVKREYGSNKG